MPLLRLDDYQPRLASPITRGSAPFASRPSFVGVTPRGGPAGRGYRAKRPASLPVRFVCGMHFRPASRSIWFRSSVRLSSFHRFQEVDCRLQLFGVPRRPVVPGRQSRHSRASAYSNEPNCEAFRALALAQCQESPRQGDRRQFLHERTLPVYSPTAARSGFRRTLAAPDPLLLGSALLHAAADCALALLEIGHHRVRFRRLCRRGLTHSPAFDSFRAPGSMPAPVPAPSARARCSAPFSGGPPSGPVQDPVPECSHLGFVGGCRRRGQLPLPQRHISVGSGCKPRWSGTFHSGWCECRSRRPARSIATCCGLRRSSSVLVAALLRLGGCQPGRLSRREGCGGWWFVRARPVFQLARGTVAVEPCSAPRLRFTSRSPSGRRASSSPRSAPPTPAPRCRSGRPSGV